MLKPKLEQKKSYKATKIEGEEEKGKVSAKSRLTTKWQQPHGSFKRKWTTK